MAERGSIGQFIKKEREGRRMSQGDLAAVSGVKRDYIGSIELGRIAVIYPETFARLKAALGFPGWLGLEAMGFETDVVEGGLLPELLAGLQLLDVEAQQALLYFVQSLKLAEELPNA